MCKGIKRRKAKSIISQNGKKEKETRESILTTLSYMKGTVLGGKLESNEFKLKKGKSGERDDINKERKEGTLSLCLSCKGKFGKRNSRPFCTKGKLRSK